MIVTQTGLALALALMATIGPVSGAHVFAALAIGVAFLSASQDIVFDAYRTDLLKPDERGLGAATWVMGYRIAMIASGSLALILAARLGWSSAYLCMAGLMLLVGGLAGKFRMSRTDCSCSVSVTTATV